MHLPAHKAGCTQQALHLDFASVRASVCRCVAISCGDAEECKVLQEQDGAVTSAVAPTPGMGEVPG